MLLLHTSGIQTEPEMLGAELQVLRKMRKLPWAENEPYLVRALLSASRGRAGAAALLASLTVCSSLLNRLP